MLLSQLHPLWKVYEDPFQLVDLPADSLLLIRKRTRIGLYILAGHLLTDSTIKVQNASSLRYLTLKKGWEFCVLP